MTMVIDFRCRPPTPHFLQYFDTARVTWLAERVGAKGLAPSFVNASMDLFWEEMDEAGIDIGVVLGRNSPAVFMGKPFKEAYIPNEHVAELQAQYPCRIVGYGGIDASNTRHDAVAETVRCVEKLGLKGIFIEPGRQLLTHPADEKLSPVYEACTSLNVPVVVMSGPYAGADIQSSHPVYIDQVATRFPSLKIVVGHGAWPWIDEMHGVAFKHPNVFISPDLYFFVPGGNRYVEAMRGALKDQFLFGTAYPLRPLVQTVDDCRAFDLGEAVSRKFFADNARPLLGFDPSL
jgi:predicted TIM-barrel fold metal-dependent hydrolase